LRVAQPALSRQIQDLEEEVGFKLFERLPRGVKLSAAGKLFLEDARRILHEVNEATARAGRVARGHSGTLRVGFTENASASFRIPSGASASSNPTRNCNFILRRVWSSWKP
jgi:DNA-binding transcriptional LysR family regulator